MNNSMYDICIFVCIFTLSLSESTLFADNNVEAQGQVADNAKEQIQTDNAKEQIQTDNAEEQIQTDSAEDQGQDIAKRIEASMSGWKDSQSTLEMVIRSPNGRESHMTLQSKMLEVPDGGDKSLLVFQRPQTVAGTLLLNHSHIKKEDEQWLYIPRSKKIQKISGKLRSSSFLGSQFSFEDMSTFKLKKFRYRLVGEKACGEEMCNILESYPVYQDTAYSKLVSWVDSKSRIQKIEYYDHSGKWLKTLNLKQYEKVSGRFWKPTVSEMVNHQNGKETEIVIKDIAFDTGLSENDFDKPLVR